MECEDIEHLYKKVHEASGTLFEKECGLIEEALAFSFASYTELAKTAKLDERKKYLLAFFYRNCVYLSATYHLARKGMLDPAGNNMRTVFETIIWQYAYLSDDAIYGNFKEIDALEGEKLKSIKEKKWSNTKERALENLRRKFSFQKMMKTLYSKEVFEKFFFNQYWAFCQKSHSSIFGLNYNTPTMDCGTTLDRGQDELKGNLSALLYLLSENLICFLNCFSKSMAQEKIDQMLALTNKINKNIVPALSLAPDTKKLEFVIRFKEIGQNQGNPSRSR